AWASRRLLLPRRCVRLPTAATSISRPNPGRGSRSGVTPRVTWDWTSGAICRSPSTSPTDTHVGRPEHQSTHPPRRGTPMKRVLHSLPLLIGAAALSACGGGGGTTTKCSTILPGDLVITEFLKNPAGVDKGQEWFEIHNPGDIELDLVGIDLAISRPDGSQERRHRMLAQLVESGGYLVVGDAEAGPEGELPEWIDYSYGTSMGTGLPNTAGRIALKCGATIIDEVIYEDVGTEAYARQLDGNLEPDGVVNDEAANWCDAGDASYDGGTHFGTPGAPNTPCGAVIGGACLDPVTGQMRDAIVPEPGQLLITEVMPNPEAVTDANGEWFEVHAPGAAVDLNGLLVGTAEDAGKAVGASESCLTVPAGGYAVLARKLNPAENGGIQALTT